MESHHKKQMQRTHQRKGWRICETGGGSYRGRRADRILILYKVPEFTDQQKLMLKEVLIFYLWPTNCNHSYYI